MLGQVIGLIWNFEFEGLTEGETHRKSVENKIELFSRNA